MKKSTPLWCEDCRFVCFEMGLGKSMLTLNDPNCFKNTTNVYSIHLELWMALPYQISPGKWKYASPCLDFLGIPDQRTAYVKRQPRPRWTYVRRSSVTLDLVIWQGCDEMLLLVLELPLSCSWHLITVCDSFSSRSQLGILNFNSFSSDHESPSCNDVSLLLRVAALSRKRHSWWRHQMKTFSASLAIC